LEELSNGKGKLAEASEEGQGPHRAVEPMTMMIAQANRHLVLTSETHVPSWVTSSEIHG
jgi:hypothetical protein